MGPLKKGMKEEWDVVKKKDFSGGRGYANNGEAYDQNTLHVYEIVKG